MLVSNEQIAGADTLSEGLNKLTPGREQLLLLADGSKFRFELPDKDVLEIAPCAPVTDGTAWIKFDDQDFFLEEGDHRVGPLSLKVAPVRESIIAVGITLLDEVLLQRQATAMVANSGPTAAIEVPKDFQYEDITSVDSWEHFVLKSGAKCSIVLSAQRAISIGEISIDGEDLVIRHPHMRCEEIRIPRGQHKRIKSRQYAETDNSVRKFVSRDHCIVHFGGGNSEQGYSVFILNRSRTNGTCLRFEKDRVMRVGEKAKKK